MKYFTVIRKQIVGDIVEGNVGIDGEFIREDEAALTLADINKDLENCGIEPITLDQIIITGIRGE